jgi:choline dehydrogenase-like flavoprotein
MVLLIRGEQAPNPASRVVLSERRDALGVPLADLDWRLSDIDKRSVACFTEALAKEFQRLGLGTIQTEAWLHEESSTWPVDPTVGNHPIGGYHHIGTTRMSSNPRTGVVDADCRMHQIDNVYIAGSSVFPTAGWANPTLTIIALALRLGDHLRRQLGV